MTHLKGWFASGYSTAAATVIEVSSSLRVMSLEGFTCEVGSTVASTLNVTLKAGPGPSSVNAISFPIMLMTRADMIEAHGGLGLIGSYMAIACPTTCAGGVTASIWGKYL